jgi:hypothetical protein
MADHIVLPPRRIKREPDPAMSVRIRKLIGTFALFALVIVWALVAMAIAQFAPIFNNAWIAAVYYVVAGIGWVLPAMPLMRWMLTGKVRSH